MSSCVTGTKYIFLVPHTRGSCLFKWSLRSLNECHFMCSQISSGPVTLQTRPLSFVPLSRVSVI